MLTVLLVLPALGAVVCDGLALREVASDLLTVACTPDDRCETLPEDLLTADVSCDCPDFTVLLAETDGEACLPEA